MTQIAVVVGLASGVHFDYANAPTNQAFLPKPTPTPIVEVAKQQQVAPAKAPVSTGVSGSCADYISAAGIDNPEAAAYIFNKESGCVPTKMNKSGCGGLGQACPVGKMPCAMTDGVCQARYFDGYAKSRYGSWSNALAFWKGHHWW